MRITVVETGYVGLVTGTCFAESGNEVACLDVDADKMQVLEAGGLPIYEPGLEELVRRNVRERRLSFTTSYRDAVRGATVVFISVGTPPGETDLSHVLRAAEQIGRSLAGTRSGADALLLVTEWDHKGDRPSIFRPTADQCERTRRAHARQVVGALRASPRTLSPRTAVRRRSPRTRPGSAGRVPAGCPNQDP